MGPGQPDQTACDILEELLYRHGLTRLEDAVQEDA